MLGWHIESETKCRLHFQMKFLVWKLSCFDSNSSEISKGQWILSHYGPRWWLGADQALNPYLKHWWPNSQTHICLTGFLCVNKYILHVVMQLIDGGDLTILSRAMIYRSVETGDKMNIYYSSLGPSGMLITPSPSLLSQCFMWYLPGWQLFLRRWQPFTGYSRWAIYLTASRRGRYINCDILHAPLFIPAIEDGGSQLGGGGGGSHYRDIPAIGIFII